MPQLDTSTWFAIIMSMIVSLFLFFQPKISTHLFNLEPKTIYSKNTKYKTPWEEKWTKIYLPLSLHPH